MPILDHWHPVCPSGDLRHKPIAVRIDGRSIALFRADRTQVGAIDDVCIHRRMSLSLGKVENGKLQCPYHAWTYDVCGRAESPGTPRMDGCTTSYETREAHGLIWIRNRGANTEFPHFDVEDWYPFGQGRFTVPAPLELTLDNFTEIEHAAYVHNLFGHDPNRMPDVTVKCESTETTVRIVTEGPHKPMPFWMALWLGINKHAHFHSAWTTYFSPLYSVFDHWWSDPATGREAKIRWRVVIFFCPVSEKETTLVALGYARSRWFAPVFGLRMFRWIIVHEMNKEIGKDVEIIKGLASLDPSLEGMKLSRFDRALGLNRERIQRVYRGLPD